MIKYKGIRHNILNDAPFIGAVIIAPTCSAGCPDCINEHLKTNNVFYYNTAKEIVSKVKENGLNKGIILSGLEWSESPESMIALVEKALESDLKVMIYTYLTEEKFLNKFKNLEYKGIYVKFGQYKKEYLITNYECYGVSLATSNQYIKYCG